MRYYSQFGEDAALYPLLKDVEDGFFVDIGAHNGVTDSNTLLFEYEGWDGICVEPHSRYGERLKENRVCICIKAVVWSENLPSVEFHETAPGGWSRVGGGGEFKVNHITHPPAYTLDSILKEHGVTHIDLLSIDVEGHENHVLAGFTLEKYNPRIIIIENIYLDRRHDNYFHGYYGVYGWEQGKRGSNIIYCRDEEDYLVVKERYRK